MVGDEQTRLARRIFYVAFFQSFFRSTRLPRKWMQCDEFK